MPICRSSAAFPLLPHLSHGDGRKLDIAYYYRGADDGYLPGQTRSPISYWAFEQPGAGDTPSPCRADAWLTTRWDMRFLQGLFPDRALEPERTRAAALAHHRWTARGHRANFHRALSGGSARRVVTAARLPGLPRGAA